MVHHRGQLTVYTRLNDIPVPSIYGPSAETGDLSRIYMPSFSGDGLARGTRTIFVLVSVCREMADFLLRRCNPTTYLW